MWLVEQKKVGIEPPGALAPSMIPPTLRGSIVSEIPAVQQEQKLAYSNPELEMISKEIEELAKERRQLETDIAQKEADIRIKSGEVRSLQSELDTLAATLKQLENQKGEAQKRLDDLKAQKIEVNDTLISVNIQMEETLLQVNRIREQCQKQEATINEQEEELNSKRTELQKLKDEEIALEKEYDSNRRELDSLTKQLQDTQLQISQVKAMVTQLLETQRQMNDALLLCKAAIEANDAVLVSDYSLKVEPDFAEAKHAITKEIQLSKSDPFKDKDKFSSDANRATNGFGTDPFANANGSKESLGFADSFSNVPMPGFDDAFESSGFDSNQMKDPFADSSIDPFGEKTSKSVTPEIGKDDFGSDPFAILHAPTSTDLILSPSMGQKSGPPPRPESPSPALPPKKSKQPPPRPAPPRPLQGPMKPVADNFVSSSEFVDFADFDKLPSTMPPTIPIPLVLKTQNLQCTTSHSITKDTANQRSVAFTDFSEDPFKDYRYEDPFSIEDPFADDDDGEKSSEDEPNISQNLDSRNKEVPQKISNMTPPPPPAIAPRLAIQENFAIFDSFDKNSEKKELDNFFDSFNDNFKSSFENGNGKMNSDPYFDPFSTDEKQPTKQPTKPLDAFNDNFEDAFFNMDMSDRDESSDKINDNFARFDAFEDAFGTHTNDKNLNNFKSSTTIKNNLTNKVMNDVSTKIPDKFASDYSKGDNFEEDLQKIIQRSLVDQ